METNSLTKEKKLKSLRTYQGDMQELISNTNASVTSIALAEQRRNNKDAFVEKVKKSESKNKLLIILSALLLIIGIGTIATVYFINSKKQIVAEREETIIGYSEKKILTGNTRQLIISEIQSYLESWSAPANSILFIDFIQPESNNSKNTEEVINMLAPSIPPNMLRTLKNEYMVGIYSFDKNVPFIVLKTNDYGISFSGMLKWEESILRDLDFMFNITGDTSNYTFEDLSLRNKDLRIVKNQNRETIFLYTFLDRETIMITTNENAFNALFGRYLNSQIVH